MKGSTLLLPETKNGSSRIVPLSKRALSTIRALPLRLDGLMFAIKPDSLTQAFARACERAGLEGFRLHDLRHTATTRLAKRLDIAELAKVTGHRDTRMLLRYYHPDMQALADRL